jgi:F-type H+-transporting ATPase subunit epsilon
MRTFSVNIYSSNLTEQFNDITAFYGKGDDGYFGILAGGERRIYTLSYGLSRIKHENGDTEYLALPGGLIYFKDNIMSVTTRSIMRSSDLNEITSALEKKMKLEEENIGEIKKNLHEVDQEILRRLSRLDMGDDV